MSGVSPLSHKFYVMHHLGGEFLVVVKDDNEKGLLFQQPLNTVFGVVIPICLNNVSCVI